MRHENQHGIRLNAAGEPDLDYYMANAHQMRSQAIAEGLRAARNLAYRKLQNAWSSQEGQKGVRQRVVQSGWPWVDLVLDTHPMRKPGHV